MANRRIGTRRAGPTRNATVWGRTRERHRRDLYTSASPGLSAEDQDAFWQQADAAGEETAGGTTPTPDQDQVDEFGEAWGLEYKRTEPLNVTKKKPLSSNTPDWNQAELKEAKKR